MRGFVPPLRLALLLCLGLAGAARAPAPTPAPAPAPSPAPRQNLHSIGAALPAADAVLPGSQFSLCELSEEEQVDLILSEEAKPFLTRVRPVEGGPRDVAVLVALYHVGRRGCALRRRGRAAAQPRAPSPPLAASPMFWCCRTGWPR